MSDSKQLEVGDVVLLKSGGPKMTVERVWTDGVAQREADCVWFQSGMVYETTDPDSGDKPFHTWNAVCRASFPTLALQKVV